MPLTSSTLLHSTAFIFKLLHNNNPQYLPPLISSYNSFQATLKYSKTKLSSLLSPLLSLLPTLSSPSTVWHPIQIPFSTKIDMEHSKPFSSTIAHADTISLLAYIFIDSPSQSCLWWVSYQIASLSLFWFSLASFFWCMLWVTSHTKVP